MLVSEKKINWWQNNLIPTQAIFFISSHLAAFETQHINDIYI